MECDKHFALLPHYWPRKLNFGKNVKNTWRYDSFTNVCHKWWSYDIWFLRYQVQQTTFFVILDYFLPFYPLIIQKIKILKKWKKLSAILSFYKWVPWIEIIWYMIPEIWSATDRIFSHFEPFFALLSLPPLNNQKNQNFEKNEKKTLEISSFYTSVP